MRMQHSTAEGPFLARFFELLNQRGVSYAVMRNYETLPESLGGSDLDLLATDAQAMRDIVKTAQGVAASLDGAITSIYTVEATIMCLAGKLEDGRWWGIHIDVFPGLTYFGIPYMSTRAVFGERVFERNSFYRCAGLSDIASFLKEILPNKRTKKDYYERARAAYRNAPELCRQAAISEFGLQGWRLIERLLSDERCAEEIGRSACHLARALWLQQLRLGRVGDLVTIKIHNLIQRCRRLFQAPGFCVAFLGTDGSGKSTLIEGVKDPLTRMLHHEIVYNHLRPNLMPPLGRLFNQPQVLGPTTNPHASKASGWLGSLARLLYYFLDYSVGYWALVFPKLVKRPTMMIFDRYFYDFYVDPRRMRVRLPQWIIRVVGAFVPAPDMVLCLGADPLVIHKRKSELPLPEVERQVQKLRHFCESFPSAVWIDTGTSPEESLDSAMRAITDRMASRYRDPAAVCAAPRGAS